MAEEHTTADDHATAGAEAPMAERVEILEEAAEGIADLQSQALDPAELSRQLEDLTSVVLNSAEVSTRSASVAADVSADMQSVMDKIAESHKRSVHHSKLILGAFLVFIIIAVGTFFAIATRMQQNIRQLDALALAVGKRVVELDTTVGAFTESSQSLFELAEKNGVGEQLTGQNGSTFRRVQQIRSGCSWPGVVSGGCANREVAGCQDAKPAKTVAGPGRQGADPGLPYATANQGQQPGGGERIAKVAKRGQRDASSRSGSCCRTAQAG